MKPYFSWIIIVAVAVAGAVMLDRSTVPVSNHPKKNEDRAPPSKLESTNATTPLTGKVKEKISEEAIVRSQQGVSVATMGELKNLKAKNAVLISLPFLSRDLHLKAGFRELFGLSRESADQLDRAITETFAGLDALSLPNTTVRLLSDKSAEITTKPFGGGGPIFDRFMAELEECLGKERALLFAEMEQDSIDDAFSHYGAEERSLRIDRVETGYKVVDVRKTTEILMVSPPVYCGTRAQLEKRFGRVVSLLPEQF